MRKLAASVLGQWLSKLTIWTAAISLSFASLTTSSGKPISIDALLQCQRTLYCVRASMSLFWPLREIANILGVAAAAVFQRAAMQERLFIEPETGINPSASLNCTCLIEPLKPICSFQIHILKKAVAH